MTNCMHVDQSHIKKIENFSARRFYIRDIVIPSQINHLRDMYIMLILLLDVPEEIKLSFYTSSLSVSDLIATQKMQFSKR